MENHVYAFEKLEVWKDARIFVNDIYKLTNKYPRKELFGLCPQIQRAAVSVVSNLAEGLSRSSFKEQVRFTEIAYGSLMEVYCQLLISLDLEYINKIELDKIKNNIDKIAGKLSSLRKYQLKQIT